MDGVRLHVVAVREAVLAGVAPGEKPVAAVLLEVLELRQHDDVSGVAVYHADDLATRMSAVPLDKNREQILARRYEEEPGRPEVLVDRRFDDVIRASLDLDGKDVLVHDLPAPRTLAAVYERHDDIVFEVLPPVLWTRIVRLLDLVVRVDVEGVVTPLP